MKCPLCNRTNLKPVPDVDNADIMGRPQFKCSECNTLSTQVGDGLVERNKNPMWENNLLQFARILSELRGIGIGETLWDELMAQTGLDSEDLDDLFERAQFVWEQAKELDFKPHTARFVVGSGDPVVFEQDKPKVTVKMPYLFKALPKQSKVRIAHGIALLLNTEPRTMGVPSVLAPVEIKRVTDGAKKKR